MSTGFPPLPPQSAPPPGFNPGGFPPAPAPPQNNYSGTGALQAWLFNQSGMVVVLSLGLLGVWWVGRDHLSEFKAIRVEEKTEEKAERAKFISALEACCKDRSKLMGLAN